MEKQEYKNFFILDGYQALGTKFWVECFGIKDKQIEKLQGKCIDMLTVFEQKFSRFNPDSLISLLNKGETVALDEDLLQMVSFSEKLREQSENVFSLYIANKMGDKGYGERIRFTSDTSNSSLVETENGLCLAGPEGLDLGGIGKGFVIDKLSKMLTQEGVPCHLINGGGDMYITSDERGESLEVLLEHPTEEGVYLGKIFLKDKGFAASSSFKRVWSSKGKDVNHFVSTSGEEVWGASYVIAGSCTVADTLATALLLTDSSVKRKELASFYNAEYLVVTESFQEMSQLFSFVQEL